MSNLILTSKDVQELEKRAFAEGIGQEDLMDLAGLGIGRKIAELEPAPGTCLVYLGKGNNAGDAIVAAGVLARVPITPWRIPPFLVTWLVPLGAGLAIGYIHPVWQGISPTIPSAMSSAAPTPWSCHENVSSQPRRVATSLSVAASTTSATAGSALLPTITG